MPVADDVELGEGVVIYHPELVNLYGCSIGRDTTIAPFVEIGRGVRVGSRCKISTHSYLCMGVTIEDEVFIGHGVMFVNDLDPPAALDGRRVSIDDRTLLPILVRRNASIGSSVVILGGVTIGAEALVGAGAVVTRDVADKSVVAGVPARLLRRRS
jgi:UDP-2-acetamido-3-amino-2,3-dideoxy-glucuronate N-acetyltransferase